MYGRSGWRANFRPYEDGVWGDRVTLTDKPGDIFGTAVAITFPVEDGR